LLSGKKFLEAAVLCSGQAKVHDHAEPTTFGLLRRGLAALVGRGGRLRRVQKGPLLNKMILYTASGGMV
jgi:hypothetical protein